MRQEKRATWLVGKFEARCTIIQLLHDMGLEARRNVMQLLHDMKLEARGGSPGLEQNVKQLLLRWELKARGNVMQLLHDMGALDRRHYSVII